MTAFRTLCIAAAAWLAVVAPAAAKITVREVKSPGGLMAYLAEDHTNPIIGISFAFAGGSALDPPARLGLSEMASALLDEGAGDKDSFAFQTELEDRAIKLSYSADTDMVRGSVTTTTPNSAVAFALLRASLTVPRFDEEPVERIRRQIMVRLTRDLESPNRIAGRKLSEVLYGAHPYSRPSEGNPETVAAITADDLRSWVKSRFARDRIIISAVGDITPAALGKVLDDVFGTLPATSGLDPKLPMAQVSATAATVRIEKNLPQSVVYFGQPGIGRADPDWYAATVADYIFGGGSFSSRLMTEVREKRGLAYGVSTALQPLDFGPIVVASVGTRSDQAEQSISVIRDEWRKIHDAGPTAKELEDAKLFLTGAWPLRFTSSGRIADFMVQVQKDKLGADYIDTRNKLIEAVTLDDVKRVSKRLYDPDTLTVVVVGPAPKPEAAKAPAAGGK